MKKKLYRQSKETANGGEKWMQRRYGLLSVDLDDTYQNFFQRVRYREKSGLAHFAGNIKFGGIKNKCLQIYFVFY